MKQSRQSVLLSGEAFRPIGKDLLDVVWRLWCEDLVAYTGCTKLREIKRSGRKRRRLKTVPPRLTQYSVFSFFQNCRTTQKKNYKILSKLQSNKKNRTKKVTNLIALLAIKRIQKNTVNKAKTTLIHKQAINDEEHITSSKYR